LRSSLVRVAVFAMIAVLVLFSLRIVVHAHRPRSGPLTCLCPG
jgi:hypothetical protein